ncbi:MAG: response regulator [Chloroflexi bacterium]|nr:response regulator [Chloroflexota bacterium]
MKTRILIIDDEPKWMQFARDDLGTSFEVEVATDLETALTKLKENRYQLIIASSRRLDVLEAIRAAYPEQRLVVATGQPTTREAINIYRLGALDYFAKDFRSEVLSQKIREAIKKPVKTPA